MNRETALYWLEKYGASTSAEIREHVGLTKGGGIPLSSRLNELALAGYCNKAHIKSGVLKYSMNTKKNKTKNEKNGKLWLDGRRDKIETAEVINARAIAGHYRSKNKETVAPIGMNKKDSAHMESFLDLLESGKRGREFANSIMLQCQQFLSEGEKDSE